MMRRNGFRSERPRATSGCLAACFAVWALLGASPEAPVPSIFEWQRQNLGSRR